MSFRCLQRALCTAFNAALPPSLPKTMHSAAAAASCGIHHPKAAIHSLWSQQKQRVDASAAYRRRITTVTAAAASQAPAAAQQAPPLDLETVLSRVRVAVQGSQPLWQAPTNNNVSVLQATALQ